MISQVIIVTVTLLGYVVATNYKGRYGGFPETAVGSGFGVDASDGYGDGLNYSPQPYQFQYYADDGLGNNHYRNEQRYQSGVVRGTYGYRDARGLYRIVQYVADARGFRANVTTNEPGTDGKENPASVNFRVEQPSAGIQDTWTKYREAGGYGGGEVPTPVPTPPKAISPPVRTQYGSQPSPAFLIPIPEILTM